MSKKVIGIIGGLGPMASVYLTELITRMTDAKSDQEHPRILVYSAPDIPDRTAYLIGESSKDPYPELKKTGEALARAGADFLIIPCVTAQAFYERLQGDLSIPVVSLCANVAEDVRSRGLDSVAVLATDGTMRTGILEGELKESGISVVKPSAEEQTEVMRLIYDVVKTGAIYEPSEAKKAVEDLDKLARAFIKRGAKGIVLGCTELSLIRKEAYKIAPEGRTDDQIIYIDILEGLARCAIVRSGAKLRK